MCYKDSRGRPLSWVNTVFFHRVRHTPAAPKGSLQGKFNVTEGVAVAYMLDGNFRKDSQLMGYSWLVIGKEKMSHRLIQRSRLFLMFSSVTRTFSPCGTY